MPHQPHYQDLVQLLRWRALHQPSKRAYTYLVDGETQELHLTYGELDRQARAIAAELQSRSAKGERALLLFPPGLGYIAAFFGCLYAEVIAVPAYPPRNSHHQARLQIIAADAQAKFALTEASLLSRRSAAAKQSQGFAQDSAPDLGTLEWIVTDALSAGQEDAWQEPIIPSDTLAFLQYTSGSTSTPKGVMVSHANILHNERVMESRFQTTEQSIFVSWLPPYHDMGLILGILHPCAVGFPSILLSPLHVMQSPVRWLQALSRYRGTISGGPNFAYDLCVDKIAPERRQALDLSSWSVAFNGAEPVRHTTLDRFVSTFASCGFRRQALYPCYGLAEATLMTSGGLPAAPPVMKSVNKTALQRSIVEESSGEGEESQTVVGCGQTIPDQKILIVHPDSLLPCLPDEVGEIWVSGPSVAQGYWNKPEETAQTFQASLATPSQENFLRTGDLGFLHKDELFVTGRLKDLIIIRGNNHYPQDIELTVEQSHPALRPGCGAAFTVERDGQEQLVIVQEVERQSLRSLDVEKVGKAIRKAVSERHGLRISAIVLIKTGGIPKTSSGKIQRQACRMEPPESEIYQLFGTWTSPLFGSWESKITKGEESTWTECHAMRRKALLGADLSNRLTVMEGRTTPGDLLDCGLPLAPSSGGAEKVRMRMAHTAEEIATWLTEHLAALLGLAPEQVDQHEDFTALWAEFSRRRALIWRFRRLARVASGTNSRLGLSHHCSLISVYSWTNRTTRVRKGTCSVK